ncbi:MAG TPA: ABC transporter permease [Thermoanaerobaculia bacterium]|nr:ABC transporter permease [Thermoanaerobaculia bacterium]HQN38997.1 ABC transporter permease [Thermoanaerobaculia bacterium]
MRASPGNWLVQLGAVTGVGLRTVPQRLGASLATIFGVAGVVAVLVAVLSIAEGFRRTLASTGAPDNALVLRAGSDSEMMSVLFREATRIVADAPGVARGSAGPLASAELFVVVDVPRRATGTMANVPLRGVQPPAFAVRGDVRLVRGRMFEWGKNEIIVGERAAAEYAGLEIGARPNWGQVDWEVVGVFAADGTLWESELWTDVAVLQPAYRRGSTVQTMLVKLESPADFDRFRAALGADPRLDVRVRRQNEHYERQSRTIVAIIRGLGLLVAALMGIGAVFGALNTMYSAVAGRSREIATLRALGFGGGPVVASVLIESLLLALAGGVAGAAAAWWAFDGFQASTLNWQSLSQVAFAFTVTPALVGRALLFALLLGLVGGLPPALRAARLPVVTALREL